MKNPLEIPSDNICLDTTPPEKKLDDSPSPSYTGAVQRKRRRDNAYRKSTHAPSAPQTPFLSDSDPVVDTLTLPPENESDPDTTDLVSSLEWLANTPSVKSHAQKKRHSEDRTFSQRRPLPLPSNEPPILQGPPVSLNDLKTRSSLNLCAYAESLGLENSAILPKNTLMSTLLKRLIEKRTPIHVTGVLDVPQEGGLGFLRLAEMNYAAFPDDITIATHLIRTLGLRKGDTLTGELREPRHTERHFSVGKVTSVNNKKPDTLRHRLHFDALVPLYPSRRIQLSSGITETKDMTLRVIDVVSPLGFGQRALIVAPPRSGKTTIMQSIAAALSRNHPDTYLMVLLIDERPEEVTDMVRSVKGEVISSTFDEPATRHVQVAEIAVEKAKRLVESGLDVVILLDNLTRLARAYNTVMPSSGKILTGGVDANALQRPKRFFGAARNLENGGSLTVIATALVETGSRMDEVIFEEFKGRGNCEIILDRKLADRRTFPAIDIIRSGTRKEEMLVERSTLSKMWILRRILSSMMGQGEAMDFLLEKLRETKSNDEFFQNMNNGAQSNL